MAFILSASLALHAQTSEPAQPEMGAMPAAQAQPNRKPMLAVSGLASNGVSASDAAAIADNLAAKLQQSGRVRVLERGQMDRILKEQNFQQSGACDGGECAVEAGRLLGIDQMVVGSVGLVGSTYTLNLRLVDVGTGEALRSSALTKRGSIDDVLTDLVPKSVEELTKVDAPEVATVAPVAPAAPPPASEPAPAVEPASKGSVWPWILGGAVVVGGGVAAALLLMDDSKASAPAPPPGGGDPATTNVQATW
jgi:hypothetical protein